MCLTRVCAHASEGHCIAGQLHTNRTQHNDVLKGIFRFPWESGSFRGGQAPTGTWGHGLGQLWQRLGPCAVLGGPVLAKSIFPVEGSLQAEQGEQARRPGAALEMHSPNLEGLRGSHPLSWAGQQRGVRTALEPPDLPPSQVCRVLRGWVCFSSVLVQLVIQFSSQGPWRAGLLPCPVEPVFASCPEAGPSQV